MKTKPEDLTKEDVHLTRLYESTRAYIRLLDDKTGECWDCVMLFRPQEEYTRDVREIFLEVFLTGHSPETKATAIYKDEFLKWKNRHENGDV